MVHSGTSGIVAVNINASIFRYITITTSFVNTSLPSSGILFHYHDYYSKFNPQKYTNKVHLLNYKYKTIGLCNDSFALYIATNQTKFSVLIKILDTNFHNLSNSGVLNYHGESCGGFFRSIVYFENRSVKYNQGNNYLKLFHIVISYNVSNFDFKSRYTTGICDQKMNIIVLEHCTFVNNSNMKSIIYALLQNSLSGKVLINIQDSIFADNYDAEIIKINSYVKLLWRVTHYIDLTNIIISSNEHSGFGHRLISSANGFIRFVKSVIIKNNRYKTIVWLYNSFVVFEGYSEFSDNSASFILNSKRGSYYILQEYSTVNITKNFVHSVMKADLILNDDSKPFCHFQFDSHNINLAEDISKNVT